VSQTVVSGAGGAEEPWTIRRVVTWATDDLTKRGSTSPRLDVELLLGKVLGVNRVQLIINADRPLGKVELGVYRALHSRQASHVVQRDCGGIAYQVNFRQGLLDALFVMDAQLNVFQAAEMRQQLAVNGAFRINVWSQNKKHDLC